MVFEKRRQNDDEKARRLKDLAAVLRAEIEGEVRFAAGDRHLYATDSSNYRHIPLGVVLPRNKADLVKTVRLCHRYHVPLTMRGSGTSLAGQTTNRAVIVDCSKYLRQKIEVHPDERTARVSPGVVSDELLDATIPHGLRFGPDPSTHNNCTIGGMIGNNACGVHSVAAALRGPGARTSDNLKSMEILTPAGECFEVGPTSEEEYQRILQAGGRKAEIYRQLRQLIERHGPLVRERFPRIPRRVSGYNLDELLPENGFNVARALAGTEGTCVTVLEASLHLIPHLEFRVMVVLGFQDVYAAGDAVAEVIEYGPDALEGMDDILMGNLHAHNLQGEGMRQFPPGEGWLMVEFSGRSVDEAKEKAHRLQRAMEGKVSGSLVVVEDHLLKDITLARESGLGVTAHVPGRKDAWEGWEDTAVPPERLGDYMRDFRKLMNQYDYHGSFYGHFGQGLVHTRIDFDLKTGPGVQNLRRFLREGAELVCRYGGSLSGEHGDGQSRGELLEIMFGRELVDVFHEFKSIWDPDGIMNPGKVVRPNRLDENLRMGSDYRPHLAKTYFQFPEDRGSLAYATERCVGVGSCRKTESGTMCPSYMATREEMHATRGRAHLLFELLRNPHLEEKDWVDETVKASLDLCLACKACKSECPVNVDMATYKAEFMAHYYKHKRRPMAAWSMGLIMWWGRIGSRIPRLANFMTQTKGLERVSKRLGGIAPQRSMPKFARQTFRSWFERSEHGGRRDARRVMLWVDTFNNYFLPDTTKAAVRVLEHAGFEVILPPKNLCCGRPLYDFGMLERAEKMLVRVLAQVQPELAKGTPIVVLEPSCLSVFRDEARNLRPSDEVVRRLSKQCFTLAEFLEQHAPNVEFPRIREKAIIHMHCHHDAVLKTTADQKLWDRLELDWTRLDSGCCGMAGSFGFEPEKYALSKAIGERRLLPAARERENGTLFIADGFSCREQVEDLEGVLPLHLAEVIARALGDSSDSSPSKPRP